jgi:2-oxo-hept-3-ene-1,7-dioate hydratase
MLDQHAIDIRGREIEPTSRTMQRAVAIEEPDYGVQFDDMFFGALQAADR